jgi:hypothetical protein
MHRRLRGFLAGNPSVSDVVFEPVDSAQAESCLLKRDGRLFLLWDENYARWHRDVLECLLRLPQVRAEFGSDAIIFGRVAELLNVSGFPSRAFRALWLQNQASSALARREPSGPSRLKPEILDYLCGLQDVFLFYHEIAHVAMRRDETRRQSYRDFADEMVADAELPQDRPVMRMDVERLRRMFNLTDDEAEAHALSTRREISEAFASLRSDLTALEELSCDLFAIDLIVETGFDLADENARKCLYAAILLQGQIQAAFNTMRLRCESPEVPIGGIRDEIAKCTQARLQARMLRLMNHIQNLAPDEQRDIDAALPFRALHNQIQGLFDEIFVPRLFSILFEDEFAGRPIRQGSKETYVRYGIFGPLEGIATRMPIGEGSSRTYVKSLGGRDLHRLVFSQLGWGELDPDEQIEITVQV